MTTNKNKISLRTVFLFLGGFVLATYFVVFSFLLGRMSAIRDTPDPSTGNLGIVEVSTATLPPQATSTPTIAPTITPTQEIFEPIDELQDLLGPTRTPMQPISRENALTPEDLSLFFEVWDFIIEQFDGELPPENELLYATISGSLSVLDDEFTRFIPPDIAARMRADLAGSFEGIGAYVHMNENDQFEIVRPISGQPAALAGVLAKDIILAVDGESIEGLTLEQAISLVRGPRGTSVTLTIARSGIAEPLEITIIRQHIQLPIIEKEILEDSIGYVRLASFNRLAATQLEDAVSEILSQNPRALIFDLRDNPGGFLDQAIAVADIFLPEGVVLFERNIRGLDEVFRSNTNHPAENIPLVVLVNAGSASAAEIVAGAIKDRDRAILIGETTFGKGSIQQVYTLSDGSDLRITIARWFTPNNQAINEIGIEPHIEILPSPLVFGGPEDLQLQRAIEYILTGE